MKNISKLLIIFMAIIIVLTLLFFKVYSLTLNNEPKNTVSEAYIPSETSVELEITYKYYISDTTDYVELTQLIQKYQNTMTAAHTMAESARALGYDEDSEIIQTAILEWSSANYIYNIYSQRLETSKWVQRQKEYPAATYIWLTLQEKGFNDYVIAGILGNMMAETGGHTLNLIVDEHSHSCYYGLCEWNTTYHSKVIGEDLEGQIKYLIESMPYEFNSCGKAYNYNFNYDSFIKMTNEKDAALAFAKCYERCTSASYYNRQQNATVAYNYFVK